MGEHPQCSAPNLVRHTSAVLRRRTEWILKETLQAKCKCQQCYSLEVFCFADLALHDIHFGLTRTNRSHAKPSISMEISQTHRVMSLKSQLWSKRRRRRWRSATDNDDGNNSDTNFGKPCYTSSGGNWLNFGSEFAFLDLIPQFTPRKQTKILFSHPNHLHWNPMSGPPGTRSEKLQRNGTTQKRQSFRSHHVRKS